MMIPVQILREFLTHRSNHKIFLVAENIAILKYTQAWKILPLQN